MSFFTEVIQRDRRVDSLLQINDMALLEPITRSAVQAVIDAAAAVGRKLKVTETYRSQARQWQLFQEGKTQLRHVGVHGYGLAADLVLINPDGIADWDAGHYTMLRQWAADNGLVWGGDWGISTVAHTFRDNDHLQRINVADQGKLFSGEWYPDESYRPVIV